MSRDFLNEIHPIQGLVWYTQVLQLSDIHPPMSGLEISAIGDYLGDYVRWMQDQKGVVTQMRVMRMTHDCLDIHFYEDAAYPLNVKTGWQGVWMDPECVICKEQHSNTNNEEQ